MLELDQVLVNTEKVQIVATSMMVPWVETATKKYRDT